MTIRQHIEAARRAEEEYRRHMEILCRHLTGRPLEVDPSFINGRFPQMVRVAELLGLADEEVRLDG